MQTVLALDGQPLLLAQPDTSATESTGAEGAATTDGAEAPPPSGFNPLTLMLLCGGIILFMFMLGGSTRKQQKKQQEKQNAMLAAMSKGDKIVTIGGIRGSVVEVRESEVLVKVDENNNTRMKFSREAIREVLTDKPEKEEK